MTRLKQWMDERGISNPQLAEHTGYDRTQVYRMVKGERPITDAFKWRFYVAFGKDDANTVFIQEGLSNLFDRG